VLLSKCQRTTKVLCRVEEYQGKILVDAPSLGDLAQAEFEEMAVVEGIEGIFECSTLIGRDSVSEELLRPTNRGRTSSRAIKYVT